LFVLCAFFAAPSVQRFFLRVLLCLAVGRTSPSSLPKPDYLKDTHRVGERIASALGFAVVHNQDLDGFLRKAVDPGDAQG
jgi:hypothetical protein